LRRLDQYDCDVGVLSHRQEPQLELVELVLSEPGEPRRFVCRLGDPTRRRDHKVVG
jgi:hypothetical protein